MISINLISLITIINFSFAENRSPNLNLKTLSELGEGRIWADCDLSKGQLGCMLDTGGRVSVINITEASSSFTFVRSTKIEGAADFECDEVQAPPFSLGDQQVTDTTFVRCKDFPAKNSPMLGANVFQNLEFSFLFSEKSLVWRDVGGFIYGNLGRIDNHWFVVPAEIGDEPVIAMFDTGAPLTMVTKNFYLKHSRHFTKVNKDRAAKERAKLGLELFKLNSSLVVGNKNLGQGYIYVYWSPNLKKFADKVEVILGYNHLINADWYFDLKNNTWGIK